MRKALFAVTAAATVLFAAPSLAQTCEALSRIDTFGSLPFGFRLAELPDDFTIVELCDDGVNQGQCVVRDRTGVRYSLYDGYVMSKFVEVGDGELPWGFAEGMDRTRAARILTSTTQMRATGILSDDNQVHVRSQFGCGDAWGQAFARYSGNRLVSVGLEAAL